MCLYFWIRFRNLQNRGDISLRQTSNYIEETGAVPASPAKKPKYYFRIPLPLGNFNLDDVLPMVKEGSILELVEETFEIA